MGKKDPAITVSQEDPAITVPQEDPAPRPLWLYELGIVLTTIIWGASFVVLKGALSELTPAWLLTLRFFFSGLCLALFFPVRLKHALTKATLKAGLVAGAPSGIAFLIQNVGLTGTTPGRNAFLTATYCVLVPFMNSVFTRRVPQVKNVIAAVLCLVGIGCISLTGDPSSLHAELSTGDILTLVAAIFFAINLVVMDHVALECDPVALTFVMMCISCAICATCALISEPFPNFFNLSFDFWLQIAYVVFLGTVVAILMQAVAQRYVPPAQAALLYSLESVFAVIISVALGIDQLTLFLGAGFVIIFVAVIASQLNLGASEKAKQQDAELNHEFYEGDVAGMQEHRKESSC